MAYVRLPLRFEAAHAQRDTFVARGEGYSVSLSSQGASLLLKRSTGSNLDAVTITMVGANVSARPTTRHELPGVSNYLMGNDPARWVTGVHGFGEVAYHAVYRGIDVVYYGTQQKLEYDFVVAPGATPDAIAMAFEGAATVRVDAHDDLVIAAGGETLVQHPPEIYQEEHGRRRSIRGGYVVRRGGEVGFRVGPYDHRLPLVIDPVLSYATYLGGVNQERGTGVAIDNQGNMIVAGVTYSPNFPVVGASSTQGNGGDAFITKLTPSGDAIVYSTYFGGTQNDAAQGVAVDGDGNAYVAGNTDSWDFPATGQIGSAVRAQMFVAKFDPAGGLVYATRIGGSGDDFLSAIAVDSVGRAHIAGTTGSADFPVVNPLQGALGGYAAATSGDSGGSWIGLTSGLQVSGVDAFAFDPAQPGTAYAGTIREGLFRTTDNGVTWTRTTLPPQRVFALARQNATIFAAAEGGLYRSRDHGDTWTNVSTFFNFVTSVAVTQESPSAIYVGVGNGNLLRSVDGGDTWAWTYTGLTDPVQYLATSGNTIYAASAYAVAKSANGGSWVPATGSSHDDSIYGPISALAVDPTNPDVAYAGSYNGLFETTSGGVAWSPVFGFTAYVGILAVAPADPLTIFIATNQGSAFTHDGGQTWVLSGLRNDGQLATFAFDPDDSTRLYAGYYVSSDAFVARLSADGSRFEYATFLGGSSDEGATSIAVDPDGNDYVAGDTFSLDFPTVRPIQGAFGGTWDSFVAKISAAGSPVYATYLGGSASDYGARIAADATGRAYVTGLTLSLDFPTANAWQPAHGGGYSDAFVTALNQDGSAFVYSTFLGGSGMENDATQSLGPTIAVTPTGEAVIAGTTQSTNFPVTADAWHGAHAGGVTDLFVSRFDAAGTLRYSTYLGGAGQDYAQSIALDTVGTAVVSGYTDSTDWATRTAVQPVYGGSEDAFVLKISPETAPPDTIAPTTTIAVAGTPGAPGWYKSAVTVSLSALDNDGGRGVKFIEYTTTGGGGFRRYTGPFQILVNGNIQVTARATDWAGNVESPAQVATVKIDTTPPSVSFFVSGTLGSAGWFKSPVTATVFALDPQGAGVTSVEYAIGNGAFQTYTAPFGITAEGTTLLTARATDANGNVNTTTTTAKIDTSAPRSTIAVAGTIGQGGWYRSSVTVTLSAVDNTPGSGVGTIAYSLNGGAFQPYTVPFTISTNGTTSITARATDRAGNVESAVPTTVITIDSSAPHSSVTVTGTPGLSGWYTSPVTIMLSAADATPGSGLATLDYSVNGGPFQHYNAPFAISQEGTTRITARATDTAGNVESAPATATVMIDGSAPVVTITSPQAGPYLHSDSVAVGFSASDAVSGVVAVSGSVDGASVQNSQVISLLTLGLGPHVVTVAVSDVAGNTATRTMSFQVIATIDSLIASVNILGDQGQVDSSPRKSLLAKLNDAKTALARGNGSAASGDLRDFVSQCGAQTGKGISSDAAALLIGDANYVLATLNL